MAKKIQLSYKEIEKNLKTLRDQSVPAEEIGYELLAAFGKGEREIARMREGKGVITTFREGLLVKGLFCYQSASTLLFASVLEELKANPTVLKAAPKIIAVSDGQTIRAFDLRQRETFEQQVNRLYCDFEFFYPLAGVERIEYVEESPADIKAAEKLAKLHDEIRAYNEFTSDSDLHDLNIFIARLLFCFFAEDTGIFEPNLFTSTIKQFTLNDGSDLSEFLSDAFNVMDINYDDRADDLTERIRKFPFVSGGLFQKRIQIPQLSARARNIIIECGDLDWQNINPDIFGSMIQAVVNPDVRANQGMHYTSVPNIMKVIQPLFLDELRAEYEKIAGFVKQKRQMLDLGAITTPIFIKECKNYENQCRKLLLRMSKMKFFDPACGSGNFLIITYKMLRLLEMDILHLIQQCNTQGLLEFVDGSVIKISQFYGIELLDFPHEIAMLSLWLAEHQMNQKLNRDFGVNTQALPLKDITQIKCGNACREDWNQVCPHTKEEEVFVFGNPPYLGVSLQDKAHKEDMAISIGMINGYKKLDYIGVWFIKGADYVKDNSSKCAFVSTNSICQGEMVEPLWLAIFLKKVFIDFAYASFKWRNNAKYNAGVTCTIVGISKENKRDKHIYDEKGGRIVRSISPYLIEGSSMIVSKHNSPISELPSIIRGCMPYDGGNLLLTIEEKDNLFTKYPYISKYIKEIYSAADYINGKVRYCLWISASDYQEASKIPEFADRFELTKKMRLSSTDESARNLADRPYQFREFNPCTLSTLVIPSTSSGNRKYIPMGYASDDMVVTNAMYMVSNAELYVFGIITSYIHMMWMRTIGGKLKTDYRYTNMCYNSFPFPKLSDTKKSEIEEAATDILLTREPHLTMGKTLADLYDPDTMPEDLKAAHSHLDDIVESCYPGYPFASDEARLECLFKMYEKMTKKS